MKYDELEIETALMPPCCGHRAARLAGSRPRRIPSDTILVKTVHFRQDARNRDLYYPREEDRSDTTENPESAESPDSVGSVGEPTDRSTQAESARRPIYVWLRKPRFHTVIAYLCTTATQEPLTSGFLLFSVWLQDPERSSRYWITEDQEIRNGIECSLTRKYSKDGAKLLSCGLRLHSLRLEEALVEQLRSEGVNIGEKIYCYLQLRL